MISARLAQDHGSNRIQIRDRDIRRVLVGTRLKRLSERRGGMIVHELGLAHAKSRIDVATINGIIHGFEIKNSQDNLERLPDQLMTYFQALQKLTLVVASRHLKDVEKLAPVWCGIIDASAGPRGGTRLQTVRKALRNPTLDPFVFVHLLWRNEVQEALACRGASKTELRAPRAALYRQLVSMASERELTEIIKIAMMRRRAWRDHSLPS